MMIAEHGLNRAGAVTGQWNKGKSLSLHPHQTTDTAQRMHLNKTALLFLH